MRILVCGSRNWQHKDIIRFCLQYFTFNANIEYVIEGEALGADSLSREAAKDLDIPVLKFPAEWEKYGKAAGPIRNKQMLEEGKPDYILAFHNDIQKSKGTVNMIKQAEKSGIPGKLIGVNFDIKTMKKKIKIIKSWGKDFVEDNKFSQSAVC